MPSVLHEALVALFRNRPTLALELLARALGVDVPAFATLRFESSELGDVVPPGFTTGTATSRRSAPGAA